MSSNIKPISKKLITTSVSSEKIALLLSVLFGFIAAIAELVMSIKTGSQAILMDCVFDSAEIVISMAFVFILPFIYKPETEKMPFGYSQLESVFMILKGLFLSFITFGLIKENIIIIINGGSQTDSLLISGFETLVGLFCGAFLLLISKVNKTNNSPALETEVISWRIDVFCCLGVSVAFLFQYILNRLGFSNIAVYIDQIVAIIIALCMLPETIKIVITSFKSIILAAPDEECTHYIKNISANELEKYSYKVSSLDVVQTGRKIWVEIYVKNKNNYINIYQFKKLKNNIEDKLKNKYDDIYVELTPDLEQ